MPKTVDTSDTNGQSGPVKDDSKRSKSDVFLGLLIPLVLLAIFVFQEVAKDGGDTYLLIAIVIFGLVAGSNRFDASIAGYLERFFNK